MGEDRRFGEIHEGESDGPDSGGADEGVDEGEVRSAGFRDRRRKEIVLRIGEAL